MFHLVVLSIFANKIFLFFFSLLFFLSFFSFLSFCLESAGSLFTNEKTNSLAHGAILSDTFATHFHLFYDVTDTDCGTQNGSTSLSYFCNFQQSPFNKQDKNQVKNCHASILYSTPVDWACPATLLQFISPLINQHILV